MKKRFLVLLLCGLMGVSSVAALAGCGQQENYDFTVWVPMVSASVGEYADHPVFQELERRTEKKVRYVHGAYDELSKMFSAGTYYDVMILNDAMPAFGGTYIGGIEKAIQDGVVLDISDKMETLAPNYVKAVNADKEVLRDVLTDSKKLASFYEFATQDTGAWYGYMMREDWLRNAGWVNEDGTTKIPVTYDDWEQIFPKFQKYNGNKAPFFLYSKGVDPFNSMSAGFGVTFDFQLNAEGKVCYGPYEDAFQDYLDLMNKWYKKGWIDKNFMLSKEYVPIGDAVGGLDSPAKYGAFPQMYIYMSQCEKTARAFGNEDYKLIAVPNPKLNAEDELHVRQKGSRGGNYAVITDKCKNPDAVMEWMDYLYSDEGRVLMNYGIEGESYTMVDGKPQYTALVTNNPNGIPAVDAIKKFSVQGFPMATENKRELQAAKANEVQAIEHTWTEGNDGAYILSTLSVSASESDRYSGIMTSLLNYTEEFIYTYISSATKPSFEDFRAELKKRGIEEAIQIKQNAYERWLKRVEAGADS